MEKPAVASFFVDDNFYYDASLDPRSMLCGKGPSFTFIKNAEGATDIDAMKMQTVVQNMILFRILHVSDSAAAPAAAPAAARASGQARAQAQSAPSRKSPIGVQGGGVQKKQPARNDKKKVVTVSGPGAESA